MVIESYKQRRELYQEVKPEDTYRVDNGKLCICHCGQVHYRKVEVKEAEQTK